MRKRKSDESYARGKDGSWQRIQALINHYQFRSTNAFARHLGLNRAENLFQIKRGNNRISRELAENICALFPEVSMVMAYDGRKSNAQKRT